MSEASMTSHNAWIDEQLSWHEDTGKMLHLAADLGIRYLSPPSLQMTEQEKARRRREVADWIVAGPRQYPELFVRDGSMEKWIDIVKQSTSWNGASIFWSVRHAKKVLGLKTSVFY